MAKSKRGVKRERTIHGVPVFCDDGECGYLICMKSVPKTTLKTLEKEFPDEESWSHERGIGIFVKQEESEAVMDCIESSSEGEVYWCEDCLNGMPCDSIAASFKDEGFFPRDPAKVAPSSGSKVSVKEWVKEVMDDWEYYQSIASDVFGFINNVYQQVSGKQFVGAAGAAGAAVLMSKEEAAEILGLTLPCDDGAVKLAFRRAALAAHPDRGGSADDMKRIINARDVLLN